MAQSVPQTIDHDPGGYRWRVDELTRALGLARRLARHDEARDCVGGVAGALVDTLVGLLTEICDRQTAEADLLEGDFPDTEALADALIRLGAEHDLVRFRLEQLAALVAQLPGDSDVACELLGILARYDGDCRELMRLEEAAFYP